MLGIGSLTPVDLRSLKAGGKYMIHADGQEAEPHCLSMIVSRDGSVRISHAYSEYTYQLSKILEFIKSAVDKPFVLEYTESVGCSSESMSSLCGYEAEKVLNLKAGAHRQ